MSNTARQALPELSAAQAQKHVTVNQALQLLDCIVNASFLDRDLTAPPGSPAEGDTYLVAASPTGAWAGQAGKIAYYADGAWSFSSPFRGLTVFVNDEQLFLIYNGAAWVSIGSYISVLQNLTLLGVNTTADATNKFALRSNAALLTALYAANGGNGDFQLKLNKESAAKTASLLYQTNFSGRAELGTTGDDDFHFKVSPDGSSWYEAIVIDRSSGNVRLPLSVPNVLSHSPAANQNNYSPSGYSTTSAQHQLIRVSPSASLKLTGLAGGVAGKLVTIRNSSTDYLLWLEHENASSSSANRFTLRRSFPVFLLPGDSVTLIWNGAASRWEVFAWPHEGMAMGLTKFDDFGDTVAIDAGTNGIIGIFGGGPVGTASSVATSTYLVNTTEKPMGVVALATGATTTGRVVLGGNRGTQGRSMIASLGCALSVVRLARQTAIDGIETYQIFSGWGDGQSGSFANGIGWEGRWDGVSAEEWSQTRYAAAAATRSNSGSPAVDGNYIWLVTFMNADWSRADMIFSTDSLAFSVAASPTTGLPATNAALSWMGALLLKSAGTTSRSVHVDLAGYRYDVGARG